MNRSVGPYRLEEQLGRGGMGVVHRAFHTDTGLPVALKMMRPDPTATDRHSVFLNELHQAAKLDHPNIAAIFDYGETTPEDAAASDGAFGPYQPYIAMELASRGSLDRLEDVLSWRDLYGIMVALLKGLAHAHARDILHRDIKPGNILLGSPDDMRPSIKLADFGLALTQNQGVSPETSLRVVGTPEYMAPEQIEGLWRDQGPWTDLYALGCVAFELASGWTPFGGETPREIALGHLSDPVPKLQAMTVLPEGYEAWLNRMLAKEPEARFQSAADAAFALAEVDKNADAEVVVPGPQRKQAASPTWTFMDIDLPRRKTRPTDAGPAIHPEDAPPIVEDWRELDDTLAPFPLTGATLSLVGIKHQRMVGRIAERDRLWRTLFEVASTGYPRAVVVNGASGIGKGHLVQWLCSTAHEAGMASSMRAVHGELSGPSHGLEPMFAHFLHTRGLNGPEVLARTEEVLRRHGISDSFEWGALGRAVLAASGAVSQSDTIPVGNHNEQLALFERILEALTKHRPVILHIADAQWGDKALQLARRLLAKRPRPLPVMVVITVNDEFLQLRPQERLHLGQIRDAPLCDYLNLEPLPEEDSRALIESVLRVEPRLARNIQAQSAGSPVFAIQMVEDLVERGLIEASNKGFRLKPDVSLTLPSSIEALWSDRLDGCLAGLEDGAMEAIRVGAALGEVVDQADWRAVCGALEIEIPGVLLQRMARAGLIEIQEATWTFTHGLLTRAIAVNAGERWGAINLACANMLADHPSGPGLSARIGRHLLAAGETEKALSYLLQGAIECWTTGDLHESLNLLDAHEAVLQELEIPASDSRWGELWIERVLVEYNLQRFDLALPIAVRVCDSALQHNWVDLQARAFTCRGMLSTENNEYSEADAMFARAASLVAPEQEKEKANIQRYWGLMLRRMGRGQESLEKLEDAAETYRRLNLLQNLAKTLFNQAELQLVLLNDKQKALALLDESRGLMTSLQLSMGIADCLNGIAEIHRSTGSLAEAEEAYSASEVAFRRAGVDTVIVPMLNRGLLQLERGHFDSAAVLLKDAREKIDYGSWGGLMPFVNAMLLTVASAEREWGDWDEVYQALRESLERTPMVERDLALPLEWAGDLAHASGERDRAFQAWTMAKAQWVSLDDPTAVERVDQQLNPEES